MNCLNQGGSAPLHPPFFKAPLVLISDPLSLLSSSCHKARGVKIVDKILLNSRKSMYIEKKKYYHLTVS